MIKQEITDSHRARNRQENRKDNLPAMVAEAALPPQDNADRLDQTERQEDARLPHQNLLRILEIDRLQGVHAQLTHGKHPEIERV